MRIFLLWLLAAAFLAPLTGTCASDTNAVVDAWFAAQKNVLTWSAEFTQTRALKTLTQPLTAQGHVWFATPNQFRWQIGEPAQTIALGRADEMYVIYPRLKRAERYSMGADAPAEWRDAMSLLQAGFPHSRQDFESQFQILSLTQTNAIWRFDLQPRKAAARKMITRLQISLATNDFALAGTDLVFADGSSMRNEFTNSALNQVMAKDVFDWQPPADFKVTSPFSK